MISAVITLWAVHPRNSGLIPDWINRIICFWKYPHRLCFVVITLWAVHPRNSGLIANRVNRTICFWKYPHRLSFVLL